LQPNGNADTGDFQMISPPVFSTERRLILAAELVEFAVRIG
jgi:hypothetical protein